MLANGKLWGLDLVNKVLPLKTSTVNDKNVAVFSLFL
jgi:hypothetical protein